jgi:DNA-binding GntR family transcriptional regulator
MVGAEGHRKGSYTAERVAAEIRRAIRHGDLLPGEHVRQTYWSAKVQVSSASTREALKMLVSEDLLTYDAHRGYFVTRIDPFEMAQVYQIRRVLEAEVLQSIRWPEPEELKAIREAMDEVIDHVRRGDGHGALDAVRRVSFAIFDLSPLQLLVAETKRFWDRAAVYRALDLASLEDPDAREVSAYYDTLLSLLEAHDREGLVALNSKHRMAKATSLRVT